MNKLLASTFAVACLLTAGASASVAAPIAPSKVDIVTGSDVSPARHYRGHRGWRGGRRCWQDCTGIGPLRVCKRRCRY